jgi:hypothetical protein
MLEHLRTTLAGQAWARWWWVWVRVVDVVVDGVEGFWVVGEGMVGGSTVVSFGLGSVSTAFGDA